MKAKHILQVLEKNLEYFQSLLSTQSDPSRFNRIATQLELRIGIIMQYIKKDGEHVSEKDLDFAFDLLRKYVNLWQLYFKNHPWHPLRDC